MFTVFNQMLCCLGLAINYIIVFKTLIPYFLTSAIGKPLPVWCDESVPGQAFWGFLFCLIEIPFMLPRKLKVLRFTSTFAVLVSLFIVLTLVIEAILGRGTSPSIGEGFIQANRRNAITREGIFDSLPLIIFAYMYQINVPAVY